MMLGEIQAWANQFISVDERLIERISVIWPACAEVLPSQPHEDAITINLVESLSKDPVVRRICHWVEFQFEPSGTDQKGANYSKGEIDIAILLDWNRERYIAYECKRLNVIHDGKRSSLATPYVTEGMMRFITNQYAENMPIGCMLGYVIDSDLKFALKQLNRAITSHKPLGLTKGPTAARPIKQIERFCTAHNRSTGTKIELRHALLPFGS